MSFETREAWNPHGTHRFARLAVVRGAWDTKGSELMRQVQSISVA